MKIPFFNKPKYMAPQVSPVLERAAEDQTGTYINEKQRYFLVKIYDDGTPDSMAKALGALEVAKDVVKANLSAWHMKEAQRKAILTPNGNGGRHVI